MYDGTSMNDSVTVTYIHIGTYRHISSIYMVRFCATYISTVIYRNIWQYFRVWQHDRYIHTYRHISSYIVNLHGTFLRYIFLHTVVVHDIFRYFQYDSVTVTYIHIGTYRHICTHISSHIVTYRHIYVCTYISSHIVIYVGRWSRPVSQNSTASKSQTNSIQRW